jgi:hypothetical protein
MQRVSDAQLWIDLKREYPSADREPVEVPEPDVREPSKAPKVVLCFTCRVIPAGNDYAGPYSAYCDGCQPRADRLPRGSRVSQCPACFECFSGETTFVQHRVNGKVTGNPGSYFLGACQAPASKGLTLNGHGVWGRPAST